MVGLLALMIPFQNCGSSLTTSSSQASLSCSAMFAEGIDCSSLEAWVQSVTGGNLVDVSADDSRWITKGSTDVFAKVNKKFVVFYWPGKGQADFNLTSVLEDGEQAKWFDYRLSQPQGSPREGEYTFDGKTAIKFDESTGGATIFENLGNGVIPPGEFLATYVNPKQAKLPADRVYPMGQRMMITAWVSERPSDIKEQGDHGFTMHGPNWHTVDEKIAKSFGAAKANGMRAAFRVGSPGSAEDLFVKMDGGAKEAAVFAGARGALLKIINNPEWNSITDVWLTGTEELSVRMPTAEKKAKGLRYLKKMHELVQEVDPEKRPLWMSDVTGTSKPDMMVTHKYLDMVGPQHYLGRCCVDGGYKSDAQAGAEAKKLVDIAKSLDSQFPKQRPHAATMSHGLHYEPKNQFRKQNMSKIIHFWIFNGFNGGLQGIQIYSWYDYYSSMTRESKVKGKRAYLDAIKLLTDNGLDYVYLWGDRRSDVSVKQVSGPDKVHGYPTISMANIQYGDHRYIILTNAAMQPVTVKLSGIPGDLKIKDLVKGGPGSATVDIDLLGYRIFKVSK